jgi:hypothetical protein
MVPPEGNGWTAGAGFNYVKGERYLKSKGKKGNTEAAAAVSKLKPGGVLNLLFHEDVYYRMGGFLILGLLIFFVSWAVFAFLVKKPGLLTDSFMVQKLFKIQTVATIGPWAVKSFGKNWTLFGKTVDVAKAFGTWGNVALLTLKYFFNHLFFVFIFIFLLNLFKVGRWSMGLIYFLIFTVMWGAVVGTNSMSFPTGENQLLGSLILFGRYGVWIWFSYLMLVLSTSQFAWLVAPKWFGSEWKKERPIWPVSFTSDQKEIFLFGLLFLLAASFAEARIFVHYNLF